MIQQYIVIGSSRGLGAALVSELLCRETSQVIGVARTPLETIPEAQQWLDSGRYRHIELDIGDPQSAAQLQAACAELTPAPVSIILNAAYIQPDVNADQSLDVEIIRRTNRVGVDGIANILEAFESHLLAYGGTFVGISSVWGATPPLSLPWAAYPASKAYLNMMLRCLRGAWRGKVAVLTVHLATVGKPGAGWLKRLLVPTYQQTAQRIIRFIEQRGISEHLHYPLCQSVIYQMFKFIPDSLLLRMFSVFARRSPEKI